jgi:hypothetical protein
MQKLCLGVIAYLLSSLSSYGDVDYTYLGRLEKLPDSGLFSFFPRNESLTFPESRNFFRLWGADVVNDALSASILADEFQCKHVGTVFAKGFGSAHIVACSQNGVDLAKTLIGAGYAKEICSETRNMYGTCEGVESKE